MSQNPMERFEDEWKAWSRRPPRASAPVAAQRLRARLDAAPSRRQMVRAWLAAAAVALVATGVWLSFWVPGPGPEAPAAVGLTEPPPLSPGVVVLWLDVETPLYMTLTPPRAAEPPAEKGDPR